MKKTITIIIAAVVLTLNSFSQAPNWTWAKSAGGTSTDFGNCVAVDANGNSYVTGYFNSATITFGSTTLNNSNGDMYLVKYDASGTIVWAKSASGIARGYSVTVDINGNIYVTGSFTSSIITFGSITLTNTSNAGNPAIFIAKYDASGTVVWAKETTTGNFLGVSKSIAIDINGNTYITGYFLSLTATFGSITLTNDTTTSSADMFVVKCDASGTVVWAKSAGGSRTDMGTSIAVDASGNCFVTGTVTSHTITFGSNTFTNAGSINIFIVKYNSVGSIVWAKFTGGSYGIASSIAADASGNIYVTGYFNSATITFGSFTLTSTIGNQEVFIVKYDANGTAVWASASTGGFAYCNSIALDANGNSYVTGYFGNSPIAFGSTSLTNVGGNDVFIAKYDAGGNPLWAKSVGGSTDDYANSTAVDVSGNIFVTGYFNSSTISFGSTTLTNDTTNSSADIFIAKLNSLTGIEEIQNESSFNIYPNPFTSQTTISFSEAQKNTTIKIMDVVGKEIKTVVFSGKSLILEKEEMQSGVYFVQITDEKKNVVNKKIIIQ